MEACPLMALPCGMSPDREAAADAELQKHRVFVPRPKLERKRAPQPFTKALIRRKHGDIKHARNVQEEHILRQVLAAHAISEAELLSHKRSWHLVNARRDFARRMRAVG